MEPSLISSQQTGPRLLAFLIGIVTVIVLLLNGYGLMIGITNVLPHLFYIPIILVAYFFPRRGVLFACIISAVYFGMACILTPSSVQECIPATGRIVIFIIIAAVVSFLTLRMQESECQFRGVAERSSDIILLTGLDGRALYVSPSVREILGYDPEEITGRMPQAFIHPEDVKLLPEAIPRFIQGSSQEEILVRMRRKDGDYALIEFSGSPVIHAGHITGLQVIGRDITERRKSEDALRKSEEKFRMLVDYTYDWEYWINPDETIRHTTPSCERITGYTAKEFAKEKGLLKKIIHPDDSHALDHHMTREFTRPQPGAVDFRIIHRNGDIRWIGHVCQPIYNGQGGFIGRRASNRDITERKRAEAALQESEHRHAMLLDAIPDMIFVISRDGIYRDFRASEKAALLIPPDQIIGKSIRDTGFSRELAEEIHQHILRAIETNTLQKFEYYLTIPQGIRQFEARIVALNNNEVLGIVRDITERKLMESALREVNKKLNLLSSITRHDIRNQLLALTAYLELSKETLGDAAKTSEYIIKEERAANAIERQIVFTKEYQDLGVKDPVWHTVSSCLKLAVTTLPVRDIHVVDEIEGLEIFADPLFEKVFYNLIDNALRYGGPKMTTIRFSHQESGKGLLILVEDDGVGITTEDKKRLFERGFGHHTGLGLFLSREILSITGITITESGEPGRGARFEIIVPEGGFRFLGQ